MLLGTEVGKSGKIISLGVWGLSSLEYPLDNQV